MTAISVHASDLKRHEILDTDVHTGEVKLQRFPPVYPSGLDKFPDELVARLGDAVYELMVTIAHESDSDRSKVAKGPEMRNALINKLFDGRTALGKAIRDSM
ncbi:hypothetical protein [Corynebacterium bovis]|nr:hypothetical protein [Corynebacterium bovis]